MKVEKFLVKKGELFSCYTGKITFLADNRIQIDTIKGERFRFWKEQLISSEEIEVEDDKEKS